MDGDILQHKHPFTWDNFYKSMHEVFIENTNKWDMLLSLIQEYDLIFSALIERHVGINSGRPQDYVACLYAARAYRLSISGIYLSASGYSDISPNLGRTIWEINLRLAYMLKNPLQYSLGYLLHSNKRERSNYKALYKYAKESDLSLGYLQQNLNNINDLNEELKTIAVKLGFIPEDLIKYYESLSIAKMCRDLNLERAYEIVYAYYSGFVHERNLATTFFINQLENSREIDVGPIDHSTLESISDIMIDLAEIFALTARIIEDNKITKEAENLLKSINESYDILKQLRGKKI